MDFPGSQINEVLLKSVYNGFKNGIIYGYRIRFIHSVALQLLTLGNNKDDGKALSMVQRMQHLIKLLKQILGKVLKSAKLGISHGAILGAFAIFYKTIMSSLNALQDENIINPQKRLQIEDRNHFISGLIAGMLVYGGLINRKVNAFNESILQQITLYCSSRVLLATGKLLAFHMSKILSKKAGRQAPTSSRHRKELQLQIENVSWCVFAGLIWASVMKIYYKEPKYLQRSLRLSMDFIYGEIDYSWLEMFNFNR